MYVLTNLKKFTIDFSLGVKVGVWYALYEAISNALQSARDNTNAQSARVSITIQRKPEIIDDGLSPIENIIIKDNGIGFTDENFADFKRNYETRKQGCKGIGKISFLKVFNNVEIHSVYLDSEGKKKLRKFDYNFTNDLEKVDLADCADDTDIDTMIILKGCYSNYQKYSRKNIDDIQSMILEHFYPMLRTMYKTNYNAEITILDNKEKRVISSNAFSEDQENNEEIDIKNNEVSHTFNIVHIKTKLNKKNMTYYCAGDRVVKAEPIDDLRKKPVDGDSYYNAYVSSDYLENNVDRNRTAFTLLDSDSLELSWEDITSRIETNRREYLNEAYAKLEKDIENNIDKFLDTNPEYSYIKTSNQENLLKIPNNISDPSKIGSYIKQIHNQNVEQTRSKAEAFIKKMTDTTKKAISPEDLESFLNELKEKQSTEGLTELTSYINYRKWIISLLDKHIQINSDDKYAKERVIHDLIAPIGSYETDSANHNLWLLDDRLAFYKYLCSDTRSIENNTDRPDIVCFNEDIGSINKNSITIIELKRPGRDNTNSKTQILNYIDKIKANGVKDEKGRPILINDQTVFHCYIVQDIETSDATTLRQDGFQSTGTGTFFHRPPNYETTIIELINYDALLEIAKKRNKIFFDHFDKK
jgi:hypothetical protein